MSSRLTRVAAAVIFAVTAVLMTVSPSQAARVASVAKSTSVPHSSVLIWVYTGDYYPNTSKGKSECDKEGIHYMSLGYAGYECYVDFPAPSGDLGLHVAFYGNP